MKPALAITGRDNVATALVPLEVGQSVDIDGRAVVVMQPIPSGHKLAIADIARGAPVIKYGAPIGTATEPISMGAHVHTHNLASGRGRGDLATTAPGSAKPSES
jgi:altronate hydrolase